MERSTKIQGFWGSYVFGILLLVVVAIRIILLYSDLDSLIPALISMTIFSIFYILEPLLSQRIRWPWYVYLAIQTGLILSLSFMRPFLDVIGTLYILVSVQATRSLSQKAAFAWNLLFVILLTGTMILGLELVSGIVISMLIVAIGIFMVSYDVLYIQTQFNQAESQKLLDELQDAHRKLEEFSSQAEELAIANERHRLTRELHDSVGQIIFSATLTSRSAQLLLHTEPERVEGQLDRLQKLTDDALSQLRSLIDQLHPQA